MLSVAAFLVLLVGATVAVTAVASAYAEARPGRPLRLALTGLALASIVPATATFGLPLLGLERYYTLGMLAGIAIWGIASLAAGAGVALVAGAIFCSARRFGAERGAVPASRARWRAVGVALAALAVVAAWLGIARWQYLPAMLAIAAGAWWLVCLGLGVAVGAGRAPLPSPVRRHRYWLVPAAAAVAIALGLLAWYREPPRTDAAPDATETAAHATDAAPQPAPAAAHEPPPSPQETSSSATSPSLGDASSPAAAPPLSAPAPASPPAPRPALVPRRDGAGRARLVADESVLRALRHGVDYRILQVCRFAREASRWESVPVAEPMDGWVAPLDATESPRGERVAYELPRDAALYWVRWQERPTRATDPSARAVQTALATSGPTLCNDLMMGPAPAGYRAACVPTGAGSAEARFVPEPAATTTCR